MTPLLTTMARVPIWFWCWIIAVGSAVLIRPPLPVDETRYLAVVWEMWQRGDFLVPYLNGEPYHHKPPLLFWLMAAGWSVFGVNDWWPPLVAPLFALITFWGTARLAARLWPDDPATVRLAPVILCGAAFFAIFQTVTMFDMMLAACTIVALAALVSTWRTGDWLSWIVVGIAIGVGVLAKGPAILLHILPVALLAPWWGPKLPGGPLTPYVTWRQWYGRLGVAVLIGAAIGLAWAVPAGIAGGEEYREMIFWGQSAGRVVNSFDHARPFWWYLAVLPPLIVPWLLWPRLWASVVRAGKFDGAELFLIAWFLPALIIFSMISGKQIHYLLPEFAALALLFARRLAIMDDGKKPAGGFPIALFFAVIGIVAVLAPYNTDLFREPRWFDSLQTEWAILLVGLAVVCFFARRMLLQQMASAVALCMAGMVVVVHLVAGPALTFGWDLRPLAQNLKSLEDQGRPIANFGYYHGQYQFLGRLNNPIAVLGLDDETTNTWIANNPNGVIVAYYGRKKRGSLPQDVTPLATHRFRSLDVYVWPVSALEKYPDLPRRS